MQSPQKRSWKSPARTPLKSVQNFSPQKFLEQTGITQTSREAPRNARIFSQGDIGDSVFFLKKGRVKLTVLSPQGREAVVSLFETGSFLGEDCLSGITTLRLASATAMTKCSLIEVDRDEMVRIIRDENAFS